MASESNNLSNIGAVQGMQNIAVWIRSSFSQHVNTHVTTLTNIILWLTKASADIVHVFGDPYNAITENNKDLK